MEPEDSLNMGDEYLSTIPEKESDKVIKSSVEDLVPIPSESEDTSNNDTCLTSDSIPPKIDDADFDSEGDILLLKKLLSDDTSSPLPSKELYFADLKMIKSSIDTPLDFEDEHIDPRSLKDEHDKDDLKSIVKVFDPGIHKKIISPTNVRFTFEDRHYFSLTFVIRIFLPYLTYSMDSSFLLSSGSEDTIFDPGISAYSFYSLEPVAYESPMMIFPFFYFCPKDKGIRGESS
ncbi:hypothetical protein Tco_1224930 [Tanacetum coccineum]